MKLHFSTRRRFGIGAVAPQLKAGGAIIILFALLGGAASVAADPRGGVAKGYHAPSFDGPSTIDHARVLSSVPVYTVVKEVTPRKACWVESVVEERRHPVEQSANHNAPIIVGGVIGGVLGHSVGHGRGNEKLGAVVGSVLGAAIGSRVSKESDGRQSRGRYTDVSYRDIERCDMIEEVATRRVFEGYDVSYEYLGNVYTTRMARDPGEELQLSVHFSPIER